MFLDVFRSHEGIWILWCLRHLGSKSFPQEFLEPIWHGPTTPGSDQRPHQDCHRCWVSQQLLPSHGFSSTFFGGYCMGFVFFFFFLNACCSFVLNEGFAPKCRSSTALAGKDLLRGLADVNVKASEVVGPNRSVLQMAIMSKCAEMVEFLWLDSNSEDQWVGHLIRSFDRF